MACRGYLYSHFLDMALSDFITDLLTTGKLTLPNKLITVEEQDKSKCRDIVFAFYQEDKLEMPFLAPPFSEVAALWAAEYFYYAVQLTIVREAGEEIVIQKLKRYNGPRDPSAIYSVDLILRHLPRLLDLAKGLAPADQLVKELCDTALQWPFSSVAIQLDQSVDDAIIFTDRCLTVAYIDRIIREKDVSRLTSEKVVTAIYETAGEQIALFWPGFENHKQPLNAITELTAK